MALLILVLILVAGDKKDKPTKTNNAAPAQNTTQLHTGVKFSVIPLSQQTGDVVVHNDQGNMGKIEVTNQDSFTWKNCVFSLPLGDNAEAGDIAPGKSYTITATELGQKEFDFRTLGTIAMKCDNGLGKIENVGTEFNKIKPVKLNVNN